MKIAAIILLAGRSERFSSNTKKQFFPINGKPLIYYTISSFEKADKIDEITLVSQKEDQAEIEKINAKYNFKKIKRIVEGGETRNESVNHGIKSLDLEDNDIVLIHDGARPLVPTKVISGMIAKLDKYEAVTAAIKVEDTIGVSASGDKIESFEDRNKLYRIQTPQGFRFKLIKEAHKSCDKNATDDAQLALALSKDVGIVIGDKRMNKITTIEDINNLETIIKNEHL